jgi:rubrerythrin
MGSKKGDNNEDHDNMHENNRQKLREMLEASLHGEQSDFAFYNTLANMVECPLLKSILMGIAGDEYGHARTWRTMLALFDCIETV